MGKLAIKALLVTAYCIVCAVITNHIQTTRYDLHVGKDDGWVAMIVMILLSSMILFLFIEKGWPRFTLGFLVGIGSYIGFLLFMGIMELLSLEPEWITKLDNSYLEDEVVCFTIICLFALYRLRANSKASIT